MAVAFRNPAVRTIQERSFAPGLIIMGAVIAVSMIAILLNSDLPLLFPYLYLLPWLLALFLVLTIPTAILYYQGNLKLYNPLVYATWSYFFPAFVVGGFMLTAGLSQPYFLSFIEDAEYNLPYTTVLLMLGFGGLSLGYFSPFGYRMGSMIADYLPKRDYDVSAMIIPGLFLLVLGILNSIAAQIMGIIGYQKAAAIESYDGIIFLTTLFWMQGTFLLWYVIFKRRNWDVPTFLVMGLLFSASLAKALFSGGRAGLFQVFVIVTLAFLLSGRSLNFKQTVGAGIALALCLIFGMIYGTTFRNVKGSETRVSLGQYTENIYDTFDEIGKFDAKKNIDLAFSGLAERFDTLSQVAVVVSTYEKLAPYEESYGLDNNIWKDISTFFIPRIIWNEKPIASEPRKYSDLYFNYGDNSFAITPIGDLLRNYGPVGVPIGMFLFGILIRGIYRSLIENQPRMIWRTTVYFMLMMAISYEGFYGLLIPFLFKVGITSLVGLLIVSLVAKSLGHTAKVVSA
ncbi:MAG: hypothetical protein ABIU09_03750 [Pyrinomonadaceae bacterium]